ncbi:hypothetical protein [Bacillus solitudinis]|uniref:hypothetical protein n=1 Tax=Bacillus solitudinis TaxID=2014074 RepID=UPI000C23A5B1|nr:hypothetical protein [Bacillus solitudinis]
MNRDFTLQQIAEGISKPLLNASDKELEGFQQIIDETIRLREAHKNLHNLVKNYSNAGVQRS